MKYLKWQYKLFIIALIISIVPVLLIGTNLIDISQQELTSSVNGELTNAADNLAKDINTYFIKNIEKLSLIVKGFENEELGPNEKVALLSAAVKDIDAILFSSLVFKNPDGTYAQAVQVNIDGDDEKTTELNKHITQIVESFYPQLETMEAGKKNISAAQFLKDADKWITTAYLPVRIFGAPKGYLVTVLDINELKNRVTNDSFFSTGGNIYIVDALKNYIFSKPELESDENIILSDAVEILSTSSRVSGVTNFSRNKKKIIAAFAFPQNLDWAVISEMEESHAYEAVGAMNNVFMIWLAGGLVLAALGVVLFTNIISRPIKTIAQKAGEISTGNFDIEIDYKPNDSLGLLGKSLLTMSRSLKESFRKIENQNALLEEYNRTLEDKVKERTIELKRTNDDLQKAYMQVLELNKEKNEFLGIAAHDLKNPLAAIKGFGNIIKEDAQMPRPDLEDYAQNIVSSSERMFSIITSLLDINKIEEGKIVIKYDDVYIDKVIQELVFINNQNAFKKNISLKYYSDTNSILIQNDRDIIAQVVDNLISNAIKFSPADKNIFITITKTDEEIKISVKDEGPGLSEEDKKKLFGKFAKLSARPTGGEHSTGLGLSIVKKLVEMIGAEIRVESELGKGADFILTFPV